MLQLVKLALSKPYTFVVLAILILLCGTLFAQPYDVAINNGRVMDPVSNLDRRVSVGDQSEIRPGNSR